MGIVVDLIIVALLLLSVYLGYRKGLLELAIKLVAVVIAIVVTFVLYRPISNFIINTTSIDETIENAVYEKANDVVKKDQDKDLESQIIEEAKDGMLPQTARMISTNVVSGGVMIILYILTRIALRFVTALANLVAKIPIIKQVNKIGGVAYGFLRGVLIIYIALLLVNLSGQINAKNTVYTEVNQSYIGKTMMEYNILNIFFNTTN